MSLALLLLPAVGGYWFVTHFNVTRFQAVRESGYHILFRSVLFGIFWYYVAAVPIWFLDACDLWGFPWAIEWWGSMFPSTFTIETVAAIVLGGFSPYVLNLFYPEKYYSRKAAIDTSDHMELLISDAVQNQSPVEISLRSRKFYIGFVMGEQGRRQSDLALSVIPVYSGHRKENNLNLVIDIDYGHTLGRFVLDETLWQNRGPEDFRVVIPVEEVVSARPFDLDVYRAFQADFADADRKVAEGRPTD